MQEKIIILHVEDSHLSQELFKRIVQDRDDIKLVQADGVIEAIYLLGSMRRVDFAVLDYKLPVYSIEEVIKILKKRKIPYIILTGYDSEDLAEEFEIEQALTSRREQGKHVIPVPAFEIKKEFSGYFLDPLQILRRKGKGNYQLVGEKSVVRPTFSYLGKYTISDYAIFQIVEYLLYQIEGINKISRFRVENTQGGIYMEIDLILVYGYAINPLVRKVYDKISTEIEKHTALTVKTINITIKSLVAG